MDSAVAAFGLGRTSRFEPDEFYESFQAPKFHDFTAPEEPIDPDAFFGLAQRPSGMVLKKAVVMGDVKTMAPKIHKVMSAQDMIPNLGAQAGSPDQQVPPPLEKISPVRSSRNHPCSSLLPFVMSNLKMLTMTLSPFCACSWSAPGLLQGV